MRFVDVPACPVPMHQNVVEFGHLWDYVAARKPKNVLEIGSLYGGTLWHWAQLPSVERLVTIDMPTDAAAYATAVREARRHWPEWAAHLDFHDLQTNSRAKGLIDEVTAILDGDLFDFAFIDGDHGYTGVRDDFARFGPLVKPGGIVAFHDTIPNGDRHEPGVVEFVTELKWRYPSVEFFDPDGVGICAFVV